ncbi:MAG: hypothetical protein II942_00270 [Alphaproteobacteria bacterium]|nr:hypothetical protein [Alphaproteobacteria bacterium]
MRPLYIVKENLGDKKFKVTFSDKHQSFFESDKPLDAPKTESTAFEVIVDNGKLKKIDVIYNDEKKMTADFFDGPMGPVMQYNLLDPNVNLDNQLRLGIVQHLKPGLHYLSRIVTDYLYPRVFHHYSDGASANMFYNPYDLEHPLSFCLDNPGGSTRTRDANYAYFNFDENVGIVECHPKRKDLLNLKEVSIENQKKQDALQMKKMAILSELATLTPAQQEDVLSATQAKLELYRRSYGKE